MQSKSCTRRRISDGSGRTFQELAIPMRQVCGSLVGALEKCKQGCVWIGAGAHRFIRHQKFSQFHVEAGGTRLHARLRKSFWRRVGVAVITGRRDSPASRPKARARNFLTVGVSRDSIRHMGCSAGVRGRPAARKTRDGKIEAAPEEVNGAAFPHKSRAKNMENTLG